MKIRNLVWLIGASFCLLAQASDEVRLDHFTQESVDVPSPWQLIQLNKKVPPTHYRVTRWDDVLAIEATAEHSMALLARPVEVDLNRTPVLCWHWRVDAPLVKADMEAGLLVAPFALRLQADLAYYLVGRPGTENLPKIRAFRDWLLDVASAEAGGKITPAAP